MTVHLDTARHAAGPASPRIPDPQRRVHPWRNWVDVKASPYLYVAPFFLVFSVFGVYPLVYTLWISLHNWPLASDNSQHKWVGLDNFNELIHEDQFWNSVYNTFGIFLISTIPQLLLALFIANLLNRQLRLRTTIRMGIIIPIVTSTAVIGLVFGELYGKDYGMINWLLHFVGVNQIDWKADKWSSWTALATMVNWRWTGYNALIYLAAMQAIPKDIYESASLDGASPWRQFWRITVPMLRPTIIFTVIISTIGGLQLFGEPVTFTTGAGGYRGGTLRQFQTVTMYMFEMIWERQRLGYAAAVAWVLFLIILITAALNFLVIRRINSDK
jgi:cellobiose transport system permease protein